jgi:DNA invertase Pin-like site-specific DNA recombinase
MVTFENLIYTTSVTYWHEQRRYAVKPAITGETFAFSYLRYSSQAQKDGDSVDRQTRLRESWLERNPHVHLDTSLRMVDAGVSGYRGEHRKNGKHALASFLDLVQRQRVPAGSYLIVENLDRLTRENPVISIPAVLNLIAAGIRVVQLTPVEMVYTADMEQHHLMNMLWELSRGHGESKRKGGLLSQAWGEKKKKAREDKIPHGRACPAWLEIVGVRTVGNHKDFTNARYRLREDAARAIHKIHQWCAEGLGTYRILDRLNTEGIPAFGSKNGVWERSYVQKLLFDPAVVGVYQPYKGSRYPNRVPDGEPITDFYPRAVSDALRYAAQEAIRSRRGKCGRPAADRPANLFSGLLWSAIDGAKLHVHSGKYRYLVSAAALHRRSGAYHTFALEPFTEALLGQLREIEASALFDDPGAKKVTELTGRLHDVEKRLDVALSQFEADPESPTWADRVSQYDREKRALVRELAEARRAAAQPLSARWSEAVALMLAKEEPDRLRAALLATISSVWCVFVRRGATTLAAVQVWFKESTHRDYLIRYHRAVIGKKARTDTLSFAAVARRGEFDLRNRKHARELEEILAKCRI